jgi:hypothetical protein
MPYFVQSAAYVGSVAPETVGAVLVQIAETGSHFCAMIVDWIVDAVTQVDVSRTEGTFLYLLIVASGSTVVALTKPLGGFTPARR